MNNLFPNWYHVTRVDVDSDELNKRWEGIEAFDKELKIDKALEALRLFNGFPLKDANFKEEYGTIFQQIDPTFRIRNNDLELRVLAGASIVETLDRRYGGLSDAVALSTICVNSRGLYSNGMDMNQDVLDAALDYLLKRAVQVRSPDDLTFTRSSVVKLNKAVETFRGSLTAPAAEAKAAEFKTAVAEPFNLLHGAIGDQGASINKLFYVLRIQREESNILWWLLGEHSRDLEKPMTEFKISGATLIAGKELADLTALAPGPRSAPAVLDRMLRLIAPKLPASITIKEAINNTPREWRERWMADTKMQAVQDLCLVHSAVLKSIETTGKNDWARVFDTNGLIKATQQIPPLDLAIQIYQERILIRFFGGE
jgi:hypothetical protein